MAMMKKGKAGGIRDGLENLGAPCPIATRAGRPAGRHMDARGRHRSTTSLGFFYILDNWRKRTKALSLIAFGRMEGACVPSCLPCLLLVLLDLDRQLRWLAWPGVGGRSVPSSSSSPASLQLAVFLLLLLAKLCSLSSCTLQWPSVMAREIFRPASERARYGRAGAGVLQRSASQSIPSSQIRAIMRGKQHGPLGS